MTSYKRNAKLITKKYFRYFFPTLLMVLSTSLSLLIDSILVSNLLGPLQMSAVNAALPILQLYATIGCLIALGASTLISISKGKGDSKTINKAFTWFWYLSIFFGLLFMIVFIFLHSQITCLLTNASELQPYVDEYITYMGYLGLPMFIVMGLSYFIQVDGRQNLGASIMIVANILNIVLDVIFIAVFHMGEKGTSLATVIGYALSIFIAFPWLFSKKRGIHFAFNHDFKICFSILKSGIANSLVYLFVGIRVLVINNIAGRIASSQGVLAYSVCNTTLTLESVIASGVSQTMAMIMGIYYGEKDYAGVKLLFKQALILLVSSIAVLVILLEIMPQYFLLVFSIQASDDLLQAVRIFDISFIFMAFNILMLYFFNVIEKRKMSLFISFAEGIAFIIPLAYLFSMFMGLNGLWLAFIVGEALTSVCIVIYMLVGRKKHPLMQEEPVVLEMSFSKNNYEGVIEETIKELDKTLDHSLSNRIGVAIEEYYTLLKERNKKNLNVDLIIKEFKQKIVISICDNGTMFNITKEEEGEELNAVKMFNLITNNVEYARIIGLNKLTAEIAKN